MLQQLARCAVKLRPLQVSGNDLIAAREVDQRLSFPLAELGIGCVAFRNMRWTERKILVFGIERQKGSSFRRILPMDEILGARYPCFVPFLG